MKRRLIVVLAGSAFTLLLAACGSGGYGKGKSPSPSPAPYPPGAASLNQSHAPSAAR